MKKKEQDSFRSGLKEVLETSGDMDTEVKDDNVFKLLPGGKGTNEGNWLVEMDVGTTFLVRSINNQDFNLPQFHLLAKHGNCCLLFQNFQKPEFYLWVDSVRFCKSHMRAAILKVEETEENEDGD